MAPRPLEKFGAVLSARGDDDVTRAIAPAGHALDKLDAGHQRVSLPVADGAALKANEDRRRAASPHRMQCEKYAG